MIGVALAAVPLPLLAQPAPSGVFVARDGDNSVIIVSGRISPETETAFAAALRNAQGRPRIYLTSPGGALTPGLNMGRMIREARLETFIPAGAGCFSACGLIWLAGVERHLDPMARVGFHAAYVPQQGAPGQVSGSGNALIGAYLSRLGYNDNAIRFFTSARPDQMFELKPAQLRRSLILDPCRAHRPRRAVPSRCAASCWRMAACVLARIGHQTCRRAPAH